VEEAIREAFDIVNTLSWDKITLNLYSNENIYRVQDEFTEVGYGYKKAEAGSSYDIAHNLLTKGMPLEAVAECTGLSLEIVEKLLAESATVSTIENNLYAKFQRICRVNILKFEA